MDTPPVTPLPLSELRERTTITVEEAGRVLGLHRWTAYASARRGDFPTIRLGRRIVVPVPALLAMLGADPTPRTDHDDAASA